MPSNPGGDRFARSLAALWALVLLAAAPALAADAASVDFTRGWSAAEGCVIATGEHEGRAAVELSWPEGVNPPTLGCAWTPPAAMELPPGAALRLRLARSGGGESALACRLHLTGPGVAGALACDFTWSGDGHWATATLPLSSFYPEAARTAAAARSASRPAAGGRLRGLKSLALSFERPAVEPGSLWLADLEILPGDPLLNPPRAWGEDCIVKRDGEMIRGRLELESLTLLSGLGRLELPVSRVLGGVVEGGSTISLAMIDGQILRGILSDRELKLRMNIDELLDARVDQLRGFGFALDPRRPEPFSPPPGAYVLTGGNRYAFTPPAGLRLSFQCPHGSFDLPFAALRRLERRRGGPQNLWTLKLVNGSNFATTLRLEKFDAVIEPYPGRPMPLSLSPRTLDAVVNPSETLTPPGMAELRLIDGGVLRCRPALAGGLDVKGPEGAVTLAWEDLVGVELDPVDTAMAEVTLWGGRTIRGRLLDATLPVDIEPGGVRLDVVVAHLASMDLAGLLSPARFESKVRLMVRLTQSADAAAAARAVETLRRLGSQARELLEEILLEADPVTAEMLRGVLAAYER